MRRMVDRPALHEDEKTGDYRAKQWRPVGWSMHDAASRIIWRSSAGRRCDGYVAISQVHHWLVLGFRLWIAGKSGRVRRAACVFAVSPNSRWRCLPGDLSND